MKILSYHNVKVPFRSAHSLYTVRTSIDLSRLGEVFFYANKGEEELDFKSVYGEELLECPSFHLRTARINHKGLAGLEKRITVLKDIGIFKDENMVAYVTQVRPLKFFQFLKKAGFKIKILLETHSEAEAWDYDIFNSVDGIVFTSRTLQSRLTEKFSVSPKIPQEVLYHRIRRHWSENVSPPRLNKQNYCIGYIGGLESWKGVDTIIEALKYLPENVKACLIGGEEGDLDEKRIILRAKELGIEKRVEFTGYVPPESLEKTVEEIDAFILPLLESEKGSLPMKLFDYMYLGKPIVASAQESIKEVLEDRVSALFFSPGSDNELAEQIKILMLGEPSLSFNLSINARKALKLYTVDGWLEKMKAFLEKI